jgi:hypothetical protein
VTKSPMVALALASMLWASHTAVSHGQQSPFWPLRPDQQQYASIDGARMKRRVVELSQIGVRYRDAGHKWDKVAVKLTMEHPSQTLLYFCNDSLSPSNASGRSAGARTA